MLEVTQKDGALIIRVVEPQLQMYVIPQFKAAVTTQLTEKPKLVVFDLDGVQHLDSSAMGALFHFQKEIAAWNGKLRLANLTSKVQQIFKITRSETAFAIYSTVADALKN